ncbi:MAG TPA: sialidase family protein [Candidatus Binatia bacterium]|nr:sialidase family protein [Candidatus Binatia bacterium]
MGRSFYPMFGAFLILVIGTTSAFPRLTPAATLSIRAPIGSLDAVTDSEMRGWVCDPDAPEAAIRVYVLQYGPNGTEKTYGKFLGLFAANLPSEQAVQSKCNSSTANHGFIVQLPPHNPTDLFYAYAQDVNVGGVPTGRYPNLANSPRTSALLSSPPYRAVTYDGSPDRLSTKAGHTNQLVSDGVYVYAQVLRGNFDEPSGRPGYHGILEIKRGRLGTADGFVTIWAKTGVGNSFAQLFIDRNGALHLMYLVAEPSNPSGARLRYEKSNNPQAAVPTFTELATPDNSLCSTCRWTLLYDRATDTIHVTSDTVATGDVEQRWYTQKRNADAAWSPKELVDNSSTLPNPRGGAALQYFYYPHLILFKGMVHLFVTGNYVDPRDVNFRGFNGIRHYYKPVNGSASPWQNEWIVGPFADTAVTSFGEDVTVTPQNRLAVLANFSSGKGLTKRILSLYLSTNGSGDWSQSVLFPYENPGGCLETTRDGKLHLFYQTGSAFLGYARSDDGVSWQFYQLQTPALTPSATMQRTTLAPPSCASFSGSSPSATPLAMITGITTAQTVDYSKLPRLYTPHGHSVVYAEVPPSLLPAPTLAVIKSGTGQGVVTAQDLDCGSQCSTTAAAYGEKRSLSAAPAEHTQFVSWSNSCSGTSPSCTVIMDMNRTVGVRFDAESGK